MQGMIRLWPSLKVNLAVAWDDESKWVERISGLKPARAPESPAELYNGPGPENRRAQRGRRFWCRC